MSCQSFRRENNMGPYLSSIREKRIERGAMNSDWPTFQDMPVSFSQRISTAINADP
jgi:hypothetical protein